MLFKYSRLPLRNLLFLAASKWLCVTSFLLFLRRERNFQLIEKHCTKVIDSREGSHARNGELVMNIYVEINSDLYARENFFIIGMPRAFTTIFIFPCLVSRAVAPLKIFKRKTFSRYFSSLVFIFPIFACSKVEFSQYAAHLYQKRDFSGIKSWNFLCLLKWKKT